MHSYLGREQHDLEPALEQELPAILNWALEGLRRLYHTGVVVRGRPTFTQPAASESIRLEMAGNASPMQEFARVYLDVWRPDCNEPIGAYEVGYDDFHEYFSEWTIDRTGNVHSKGVHKVTFGKALFAALPLASRTGVRSAGDVGRIQGIRWKARMLDGSQGEAASELDGSQGGAERELNELVRKNQTRRYRP